MSLLREIKYEDYKNDWYIMKTQKNFYDPDSPSSFDSIHVPHQALVTSSSRKLSREVGMLRHARDDTSIPGNVFDCQQARRDPDELQICSRKLATL